MKISKNELMHTNEQETLDRLYEIPGVRVPGRNHEFYKSLITATCVKIASTQPPWYITRLTKYFCEHCYINISINEPDYLGLKLSDKHQLIPGHYLTTHCSIYGLELFKTQNPYKCNDCKLAWILNRVTTENGGAISITWEKKI